MDIFNLFTDTLKKIIAAGPKINADERHRIQEVVGELGDTLSDSLSLTIIYLSHARHARDHEFADHLANARERLHASFFEFKVCGGLYNLRDRFSQLFDPALYTLGIGRMGEIRSLIHDLANGERSVIDFLRELTDWMTDEANELRKLTIGTADWIRRREAVVTAIDGHIAHLRTKRDNLVHDVRHIMDRM
jgi:hypothetical protein